MDKIKKILSFAMRMEKDAGDFYGYYMDKVKSTVTRELFHELAETEKQHYSYLKSKYVALGYTDPPIAMSWVVDNAFTAKDPHILSDNSDVIGVPEGEMTDLTIIRMAYLIENDFALFYKNSIDLVDDEETKKFLTTLSQWEEQHKNIFYEKYHKLLKAHWSDIASIIFPD